MMNKVRQFLLTAACVATVALAPANALAASGWINGVKVSSVMVLFYNGSPFVQVRTNATSHPAFCGATGQYYFSLSTPGAQQMLSVLTAAQLAGKSINVNIKDTCFSPFGTTYAAVDATEVLN